MAILIGTKILLRTMQPHHPHARRQSGRLPR
jgi:hypothetical protein